LAKAVVFNNCLRHHPLVTFNFETEQEAVGNLFYLGDPAAALAHGATREEAILHVEALGLRVLVDL
jgi:hypothetical protein